MKPNVAIKRSVDVAMYILFLLLMGQCVLRGAVHEWLGISAGILFLYTQRVELQMVLYAFKG